MLRRRLLGLSLILHGLAHALPGMRATLGFRWIPTLAWAIAVIGFVGAGAGLLRAARFRNRWPEFATAGALASMPLLLLGWHSLLALPGLLIDLGTLVLVIRTPRDLIVAGEVVAQPSRRARVGGAFAALAMAALSLIILTRPWHMRWGTTDAELAAALPGDELIARPMYLVQHAITIPAPPDQVWPWLVQLGQDRGGFYSYAWLENLWGLGIRNADRIHPEWQIVRDSIYATPFDYLGTGRRFGWRLAGVEPGRAMVLENWGAFVLEPTPEGQTRFIVRSRGAGTDRLKDLLISPAGLVFFEPAHFIMERKMLLEVKRLASNLQI